MQPEKRPTLSNRFVLVSLGFLVILSGSLFFLFLPGITGDDLADSQEEISIKGISLPKNIVIPNDVRVGEYFQFMDSLVSEWQQQVPYELSEHLIVHANPWILDTLADTDYYRMIMRDSFVYDQKKLHVLRTGDSLQIPSPDKAGQVLQFLSALRLDINIPEYKMRIYSKDSLLHEFLIRIGQNHVKYLAMGDRLTDLRTLTGTGTIVRHAKDPDYYNPVNHERFYTTMRDDGKRTLMPQIPWIETEINNVRNGQMIHPTTNPKTLGKAYSNGCIGTREADAWIIYYHAPLGTLINIRYDRSLTNGEMLPDIYERD